MPGDNAINEQIVEVRYHPESRILDHIGGFAAALGQSMGLSDWQTTENRADVFSPDQTERCFVSFRNFGLVIHNTETEKEFTERAHYFISQVTRIATQFGIFSSKIPVQRIGVRSRFGVASSLTFPQLVERYLERVIHVSSGMKTIINNVDGKISDIGGPIHFETNLGKLQTSSGPMERGQLASFFDWSVREELPLTSLYIDIDYSNLFKDPILVRDITHMYIKPFIQMNWLLYRQIRALVIE